MIKDVTADPSVIFQAAEAFLGVKIKLRGAYERGEVLPVVLAVNSALALELYLKCLRTIEVGSFPWGHELDAQFRDLNSDTQEELRRRHDEAAAAAPFFSDLRARGIDTDLDSLLAMGRKTFVNFRYAFENDPAAKDDKWALDAFVIIVRGYILEKHPEWRPVSPGAPR